MKALRYLLIAIVVMLIALPAGAQYSRVNSVAGCTTFGQTERQYQFYSTSAILTADTKLGLSEGGAFTTGVTTGKPLTFTGPKRVGENDGFEPGEDEEPDLPGEPYPIGDGVSVLLLLSGGYVVYRRRKLQNVTD